MLSKCCCKLHKYIQNIKVCVHNIRFIIRQKKKKCVFPIDPKILPLTLTFFMPKKKNRSVKSGNSSPFPCLFQTSTIDGRLTVAILTLSDKRLIETDLLKTGFLFEFSSFPCTFDRCYIIKSS